MYDKLDRGAVVIHVNYTYRMYNCIHIGVCSGELVNLVAVLTNQVAAEVVKREAVEASLAALTAQVAELTAYHRQVQVRVKLMLLVHTNYYRQYRYC